MARFEGGTMTSDAGALRLGEPDRRLTRLPRRARCFHNQRDPRYL